MFQSRVATLPFETPQQAQRHAAALNSTFQGGHLVLSRYAEIQQLGYGL